MNIAELCKEKLKDQPIEAPSNLWAKIEDNINISDALPNQNIFDKATAAKEISKTSAKMAAWKITSLAVISSAVVATTIFITTNNTTETKEIVENISHTVSDEVVEIKVLESSVNSTVEEANVLSPLETNTTTIPVSSKINNVSSSDIKNNPLIADSDIKPSSLKDDILTTQKEDILEENTTQVPLHKETVAENEILSEVIERKPVEETAKTENNIDLNFKLTIPNVITPNGDSYNDFWVINNLDKFTSYLLRVVDTRGKKIFETSHYKNDWNGEHLPNGTYYYTLKYVFNNKESYQNGIIQIIR